MAEDLQKHAQQAREKIDQEVFSAEQTQQLWRSVQEDVLRPRRAPWLWPAVAISAASAAAAVIVALGTAPTVEEEWYEVLAGFTCIVEGGDELAVRGTCQEEPRVRINRDKIRLVPNTQIRKTKTALTLDQGGGRFQITERREGESRFSLLVTAGAIHVLGTVFDVRQFEDGHGYVDLHSGRINFEPTKGQATQRMEAGQKLQWSSFGIITPFEDEAKEPDTAAAPEASKKSTAAVKPRLSNSMNDVLQQLFRLRSQRRYRDAARYLENAQRNKSFTKVQRARLSYEQGLLFEDMLHDRAAACRHWHRHKRKYPNDRADDVKTRLLRCD